MNAPYVASQLKRQRATNADIEQRRADLQEIVSEIAPCTVRQVFYQASVRGIVQKTEAGYGKVQRMLVDMRRAGEIAYGAIVDNTRWMRKPRTFDNLQDALDHTAAFYRRSLWTDAEDYVEIWLEKDALSGVIFPVTAKFDVPLMVARGYASLSFLASAAEAIAEQNRPVYIYHLGDFDPSGVNAGEKIEETLRQLAPAARHESFAEMEASMRANLAEMEARAHAQVRETFAKQRERLEIDLARAGHDMAVQRGVH